MKKPISQGRIENQDLPRKLKEWQRCSLGRIYSHDVNDCVITVVKFERVT